MKNKYFWNKDVEKIYKKKSNLFHINHIKRDEGFELNTGQKICKRY